MGELPTKQPPADQAVPAQFEGSQAELRQKGRLASERQIEASEAQSDPSPVLDTNPSTTVDAQADVSVGNTTDTDAHANGGDAADADRQAGEPASRTLGRSPSSAPHTKAELVLKRLRSARGATLPALMEETGWQAHSVRGFLSGTVRKRLGLELTTAIGRDGVRRYRIAAARP